MGEERLSLLILAGGRSRRLGRDKTWLPLDGLPLVERVARNVLSLANEVIFSTNSPDRFSEVIAALPVPAKAVADQHPGRGPLAGLYAGLNASCNDLVLALATDLPFVDLALLRYMVDQADGWDVVVPQIVKEPGGELYTEPLHALYRRSCLPAIEAQLSTDRPRIVSFYPDVRVRYLRPREITAIDPQLRSFFNINTEEDWLQSQKMSGAGGQASTR